jgi:phosphohistidine phosphatase
MKQLAVLRHAKSSWENAGLDDFDRPLNDRGWKAARRMGRELQHRGMRFDFVLASTAARVRETIDGVQENFDFRAPIQFDQRMYLASEELLLELIQDLRDTLERPLLVGHNPGLERLLTCLASDDDNGLRDRIVQKFPTCAFALLELPVHRWADVKPGSGKMLELILPKELR